MIHLNLSYYFLVFYRELHNVWFVGALHALLH
jgi:hypothetical protein